MKNLFPPAYDRRLLDHLPKSRRYRELRHRDAIREDGHSARRKFYLYPEHLMLLPAARRAFWLERSAPVLLERDLPREDL